MATDDFFPNQAQVNESLRQAIEKVYLPELVARTPAKTGYVAGSWELIETKPGQFAFYNPYGEIVLALEFGRKKGGISAKTKKMLKFKKRARKHPEALSDGERKQFMKDNIAFEKDGYIYSKKIWHPGFEARRFIKQLFDDPALFSQFEKELSYNLGK